MSALGSFYFILSAQCNGFRLMERIVSIQFLLLFFKKIQTFLYNIFVNKIGVKWKKKRLDNEFYR